ncbi:MAG: cobalamin-dependent protein [Bacillota bacterium]|nr:cobalamin-dependent protein [Bacillota bacterium]
MTNHDTGTSAFRDALERMDKPLCVRLAVQMLQSKEQDIVGLYTQVLAPTLNNMTDSSENQPASIWREHIRSSIIRTIIECCYPYVLTEAEEKGTLTVKGKVVIVSPTDEYHELGARMGSDFFHLCGYETIFVGSNTPRAEMLKGLELENPDYVVINAVNFYNVFKVQKIVAEIKAAMPGLNILASGYAFRQDPNLYHKIGAISVIRTIDDILALEGAQS